MLRNRLLTATMVAVAVLSSAGAAYAAWDKSDQAKEITAVLKAKTSLADAIKASEKHTGGRAAKVERHHGAYVYEVKTVSKEKVTKSYVDPASGKVMRTKGGGLLSELFGEASEAKYKKLEASPVTLAAAVATAEKDVNGKAVKALFSDDDGRAMFKVRVADASNATKPLRTVMISPTSGKVVKIVSRHHKGKKREE